MKDRTRQQAFLIVAIASLASATLSIVASEFGTALLAVLLFLAVLALPSVGLAIPVFSDSLAVPVLLAMPWMLPLVSWIAGAAAIVAFCSMLIKSPLVRGRALRWLGPVGLIAVWGTLVGLSHLPTIQVMAGLRIAVLPLIIGIAAAAVKRSLVVWILNALGLLLVANAVAALVEIGLGVSGLLNVGLVYGESIRTVDSVLRPPGLFIASYVLGGYAAVYAVITLGRVVRDGARIVRLWGLISLTAALACILLSTSRFALIILVVGVLALVLAPGTRLNVVMKVLSVAIATSLVIAFLEVGLSSAESLAARFGLWQSLLDRINLLFGAGWGSAGSASVSHFSAARNTTDNYVLNIAYQLGLLGILAVVVAIGLMVRSLARSRHDDGVRLGALATACGVIASFAVTETWEYTGAMCLLMLCIGSPGMKSSESDGAQAHTVTNLNMSTPVTAGSAIGRARLRHSSR